jgi:hypothetical protein
MRARKHCIYHISFRWQHHLCIHRLPELDPWFPQAVPLRSPNERMSELEGTLCVPERRWRVPRGHRRVLRDHLVRSDIERELREWTRMWCLLVGAQTVHSWTSDWKHWVANGPVTRSSDYFVGEGLFQEKTHLG